MKKWELISEAYQRFPKGTRFKSLLNGLEYQSNGSIVFGETNNDLFCEDVDGGYFSIYNFNHAEWATIVTEPEKIAVKVESEREFKLLMEYYESKGWKSIYGLKSKEELEHGYIQNGIWALHDSFSQSLSEDKSYTIISFPDFAKQHGIETREPLIVSEDGVKLFEDSPCHVVWVYDHSTKYFYHSLKHPNGSWNVDPSAESNGILRKIFSTEQAMDNWIAKQHKEIQLDQDTKATISKEKDCVVLEQDGKTIRLSFDSVSKLAEACR